MSKVLYLDTETTGLDPVKNDIIQLALIVEIGGAIIGEYNFKCQPFSYDNIETEALLVHGMKMSDIEGFPAPEEMFLSLEKILNSYINKYDKADKFLPAGYNTVFDLNFLSQFYKKARPDDNYGIGSFVKWQPFDLLAHLRNKAFVKGSDLANFKLETVAKAHNITFDAHDALADIRVTRELVKEYSHEFC